MNPNDPGARPPDAHDLDSRHLDARPVEPPSDAHLGPYDPVDHPPPLDVEAWMTLSAALGDRDLDEQDLLLEGHHLDRAVWDACDAFWLTELAAQCARKNFKLAERYAQRCMAARASRPDASEASGATLDHTAFMTALADDTAIPFANAEKAHSLRPSESTLPPHPDTGATGEMPALKVPDTTLPFDD